MIRDLVLGGGCLPLVLIGRPPLPRARLLGLPRLLLGTLQVADEARLAGG